MKLLLTSAGITNPSIARALRRLAGKDIRTAFIPTAANIEDGDKGWLRSTISPNAGGWGRSTSWTSQHWRGSNGFPG